MKRQLMTLGAVGAIAAGMIFAQTQAPAQSNAAPNPANVNGSHRMGRQNGHMRGMRRMSMMHALNLTPQQKTRAKAIFEQSREAAKPVREQLRQNRAAMAAAVKADNKAQIAQLGAARGNLMGKLTTSRTEAMARFYQELTPQQRAKADQIHARVEARMHQRRIGARPNNKG